MIAPSQEPRGTSDRRPVRRPSPGGRSAGASRIRSFWSRALLAAACVLLAPGIHAQPFPSKPVRVITPGPPGGAADTLLRLLAIELSRTWNQPVLVENKPGGTGALTMQALQSAPNDGHVIALQVSGFMAVLPLAHGSKFDPLEGATPIAFLTEYPLLVATSGKSPFGNWSEYVDFRRSSGKQGTYGISGVGGTPHLVGEQIKRLTGFDMQSVPYKGDSPMLADLVGGQVDVGLPILASAMSLMKDGQIKGLAVTSANRAPFAPDIPTLKEQGVNVVAAPWAYMHGPAKMDPALADRIARDIAAAMKTKALRDYCKTNMQVWTEMSREQLVAKVKAEAEVNQALLKELKVPLN